MNDTMERRLRDTFDRRSTDVDAAASTAPPAIPRAVRARVRRRQAATVALSGVLAAAVVVGTLAGIQTFRSGNSSEPATRNTTATSSARGVTVTHPSDWTFAELHAGVGQPVDPDHPDAARGPMTSEYLFALTNLPGPTNGRSCDFVVPATTPSSVWLVVQADTDFNGGTETYGNWPAEPRPAESDCDGTTLEAHWQAAGRFFTATLVIGDEATQADRDALRDAFDSLTFGPDPGPDGSAGDAWVSQGNGDSATEGTRIAHGSVDGQEWALVASAENGDVSLEVQFEASVTGIGGFATSDENVLEFAKASPAPADTTPGRAIVVFGAAAGVVARVAIEPAGDEATTVPLPPDLHAEFRAFAIETTAPAHGDIVAYDSEGNEVGREPLGPGNPSPPPGAEPGPPSQPVEPTHGGTFWAAYVAVGDTVSNPDIVKARKRLEAMGVRAYREGDSACDRPLDRPALPEGSSFIGVYFDTFEGADGFGNAYADRWGDEAFAIRHVRTYCLD